MSPEPEVNNTPWTPEWDVKDPVLERAEKALADADKVDASDTKDSIQEKIDAAQKAKDDLVKQFNQETDSGKKAKMNTEIGKMTASIAKLEARHDAILQKAEKVLKAASQPGEKLAAKQADVAGDIREIDAKIAALKPGDPQLTELLEEKDKLEKKQERLEKKEERTEMIARAKEYHVKAEELHRQEEQEIETKTDAAIAALNGGTPEADIKTPPAPAPAPKETQEGRENNEGLSHADQLALGMAMEMVSYPPKTPGAKIFNGFKAFVLRFWCANGSKDYLWANEMPADKLELLGKVVGLKLTPTGKTNTEKNLPSYKAEWGPADPEYLAPDRTTQEVFAKFMKVPEGSQDWIPIYDRVALLSDGKPTIEDVLKSIPDPIPAEDLNKNAELKELVLKVQEISGNDPKADFFESLSKYGFQLLGKKAPETGTTESKVTIENSEDDSIKAEFLSVIQERKFNSQSPSGEIVMAVFQKRAETFFASQKIDENMAMQMLPFLPTATQKTLVDGSSLTAERKTALNGKLSGETGTLDPKEVLEVFAANRNAKTLVLEAISWPKLQASTAKMPEGEIKNALSKNFSTPVASLYSDDQEILAALKANDPKVEAAGTKPPEAVREKAADTKTILIAFYGQDADFDPAHSGDSTVKYLGEHFPAVLDAKIAHAPSQEALMQMVVTLPTALQREIVSQSSAPEDEKVEAMIQLDKTGTMSLEKATDLLGTFNFEMTKTQLEGIVKKIDPSQAPRLLGLPETDWKKPITETAGGLVRDRNAKGWGEFQDGFVMSAQDLEAGKKIAADDVIHRVQAYGFFLDDGTFQVAPLTDRLDQIQYMKSHTAQFNAGNIEAQRARLETDSMTIVQQIHPDDLIHGLWLNNKEANQNEADYQKLQVNQYSDSGEDYDNYHYDAVSKSWIGDKGAPMVLKPGSSIVLTMPEEGNS